jgi:hypothetical protein
LAQAEGQQDISAERCAAEALPAPSMSDIVDRQQKEIIRISEPALHLGDADRAIDGR